MWSKANLETRSTLKHIFLLTLDYFKKPQGWSIVINLFVALAITIFFFSPAPKDILTVIHNFIMHFLYLP